MPYVHIPLLLYSFPTHNLHCHKGLGVEKNFQKEGETGPTQEKWLPPMGAGRWWGKWVREWIQCKKCVHMHVNAKVIPAETVPWIGGGEIKENGGGLSWSMM
jgi:hypothetical protein